MFFKKLTFSEYQLGKYKNKHPCEKNKKYWLRNKIGNLFLLHCGICASLPMKHCQSHMCFAKEMSCKM